MPHARRARGVYEFKDWTYQGHPLLLAFDHTGRNVIGFRTYASREEYDRVREELWDLLDLQDPVKDVRLLG